MTNNDETRIIIDPNSLTEDEARIMVMALYGDLLRASRETVNPPYEREIAELLIILSSLVFSPESPTALEMLNEVISSDLRREDILLIDLDTPIMRMIDYMP